MYSEFDFKFHQQDVKSIIFLLWKKRNEGQTTKSQFNFLSWPKSQKIAIEARQEIMFVHVCLCVSV